MGALHQLEPITEPVSPKDRLGWFRARGHLTESQAVAGGILMMLAERKEREAYATSNSSGQGGNLNPLEAKATARSKYERALSAITPMGAQVVDLMVLQGLSSEQAAKVMGLHHRAMLPLLRLTLEVLARHYHVPD